jgi:LuxR family transcriptional regulator, quorum-sensing system regulator SolR
MPISDVINDSKAWAGLHEALLQTLAQQAGAQAAVVRIPWPAASKAARWVVSHWPQQAQAAALAAIDPAQPFPPVWVPADESLIIRAHTSAADMPHDAVLTMPSTHFTLCIRVAIPMPLDVALECIFYFDSNAAAAPSNAVCAEAVLDWLPQFRSAMRNNAKLLTRREAECMRMACQGMTAGEVAQQLDCSERTVNWHYANVMSRLGVRSKLSAALLISWLGLI